VVVAAAESFDRVGLPEGRFPLAHAALYLATAAKSNSAMAFFDALSTVEKEQEVEVPSHLKDASRDSEGFGHGANYLYPHAYREHWVAQQYLPASFQGRLFYQPSDQGYEKTIRDQVHRRRELQLAAMAEGQAPSLEVLTFSPPDKARDQWLQRAAGQAGAQLEQVRQKVFAPLALERHHLVLDLNAGTGLFTWEALRRVPEGGVWAQVADKTSAVALHEVSASLPEIERPRVLQGPLLRLAELVEAADPKLCFDAIIGRNALGNQAEKPRIAALLFQYLAPGGCLSLVETLSRRAQRLYRLVELGDLDQGLKDRLLAAEEAIYAEAANPQLTWDQEDLEKIFRQAGFARLQLRAQESRPPRRLSPQQLDHWFSPGGQKRPTYADWLRRLLDEDELRRVRRLFERQLADRTVEWSSTQLFLVGER
jgi:putative ATPase